ncbi:DUF4830 domain-containing protein [Ruminococcus sp.]|uniref:DUF4830 domain-containing protein n=1 Tax=Ruminococcus sp. TaxID=41978 RepID=UPI0025EFAC14|nr:DUF4830 domain-containing protein [Ruminococcus sp.]
MGKRVILTAGILGLLFGCGWLAWWIQQEPPAEEPVQIILEDEAARTEFLRAQGQPESRCITAETVQLPVSVDDAYEDYAALQGAQKLPLTAHLGETATRYTYTQSSSGQDMLRTELLIDENQMLIGAVQYDCTAAEEMTALLKSQ